MPRHSKPAKPDAAVSRFQKLISEDLGAAVALHLRTQARGKRAYKQADMQMKALAEVLQPGQVIALPAGRKTRLKDNWEGKIQVNTGSYARRFEFEDVVEA